MQLTQFLQHPTVILAAHHRRWVWAALLAEVGFLCLGAVHFWTTFRPPFNPVKPSNDSLTLLFRLLSTGFPAILVLVFGIMLLVLLPGWIASTFLEDSPSVVGSIFFGFASLGGLVLLSQFLHIPSIWPALVVHVGWQVVVWRVAVRQRATEITLPSNGQWLLLVASLILIGLFAVYLSPVVRLDTVDNWNYVEAINRLSAAIGTMTGSARNDWNAWIAVNAWIVNLTGIAPLALYQLLGWTILMPLDVLLTFGIVRRLSHTGRLAAPAAWFGMLALVTSSTLLTSYLVRAEFIASDKWIALVLLVPAGLAVMVHNLETAVSWRRLCILGLAIGTPMLFHAEGLTVMAWLGTAYLLVDLILGCAAFWRRNFPLLLVCLAILFVVVPVIFPRAYQIGSWLNGSTRQVGLGLGTYVLVAPDWFIVNPAMLLAPLLLGPFLLTLVRGLRRSDAVGNPLQKLLFSWAWAVAIFFFPPFPNVLDRFWFPTWLERFVWTLPFGILTALGLWTLVGQRRRLFMASCIGLTVIVLPLARLAPSDVDWRLNQQPIVDEYVLDVVSYFRNQGKQATGTVLSPIPGPQTILVSELGPSLGLRPTNYGFPDIRRLYAAPWWGTQFLKTYIVGQVDWLIAERGSVITAQLGLQADRYTPVYENAAYRVYRVARAFPITPLDDLVDKLATPDKIDVQTLPALAGPDRYAQVIVGLAYQATGQCDQAILSLERVVAQSTFAREPYLQTLAACQNLDKLRAQASAWREDSELARTLLSEPLLRSLDQPTLQAALKNWLAHPYTYRDEVADTTHLAEDIATLRGQPDLALLALGRLPDILLDSETRYQRAYWSVLDGHPDPALFRQAGREDDALLLEGQASTDPSVVRRYYQAAVDGSHSTTAYMFLGQSCEVLHDYPCASAAYEAVIRTPNDPMALYGAMALARVQAETGNKTDQTRQLIRSLATGLSLSYVEDAPFPVFKPLTAGQALRSVLVSARWRDTLTDHLPDRRLLEVTFTNPLPHGKAAYATLGFGNTPSTQLAVYVPGDASVTWTVLLTPPPAASAGEMPTPPDGPYRVSIFDGLTGFIADTPSWLPLRIDPSVVQKPLATFGDGLQLLAASATCQGSNQTIVTLTWLPTRPLNARYTLFIHTMDASGNEVAQIDRRPFNDAYPTDSWLSGYAFTLTQVLPVADPSLRFRLGWYQDGDGSRLPLDGNEAANGIYELPMTTCSPP